MTAKNMRYCPTKEKHYCETKKLYDSANDLHAWLSIKKTVSDQQFHALTTESYIMGRPLLRTQLGNTEC